MNQDEALGSGAPGTPRNGGALAASRTKRVLSRAGARAAILVEGPSDWVAIEALAARRRRDLAGDGVAVVTLGGATNLRFFLDVLGPGGLGLELAGLCDAGEEPDVRRALEDAGLGSGLSRTDLEALGFFVCVADLEDELIRALGVAAVERVLDEHGDLGSFRTLQRQPAWRGRPLEDQLRRFLGAGARRKVRYARAFVEALEPAKVPRPLDGVLARV